jgi:hypothetical protein
MPKIMTAFLTPFSPVSLTHSSAGELVAEDLPLLLPVSDLNPSLAKRILCEQWIPKPKNDFEKWNIKDLIED